MITTAERIRVKPTPHMEERLNNVHPYLYVQKYAQMEEICISCVF